MFYDTDNNYILYIEINKNDNQKTISFVSEIVFWYANISNKFQIVV